jgi:hypothetical protein
MSLARGISESEWIRSLLAEFLNPDYDLSKDKGFREEIRLMCLIDSKPIYDHNEGDGVVVKNKREAIDMLLVRRDIRQNNIVLKWIETANMLADVLTKLNAPTRMLFHVINGGGYGVQEFQASKGGV